MGRTKLALTALVTGLLSSCLFLRAEDVVALASARLLSGASVGLIANCATTLLIDLESARPDRSSAKAAVANTGGLAIGALTAGLACQYISEPTKTVYIIHIAMLFAVTVGLGASGLLDQHQTRTFTTTSPRSHRVRSLFPTISKDFSAPIVAAGIGFAFTGIFTAASGLLVRASLGHDSPMLSGIPTFLAFSGMAIGQIWPTELSIQRCAARSSFACFCAAVLFTSALKFENHWLLFASAGIVGIPTGVGLKVGLTETVGKYPPGDRSVMTSTYFILIYSLLALPAVFLGILAGKYGLTSAGFTMAIVLGSLSLISWAHFTLRISPNLRVDKSSIRKFLR